MNDDVKFRTCVKCLKLFPLTQKYFSIKRRYPDGRQTHRWECRYCENAYRREYEKLRGNEYTNERHRQDYRKNYDKRSVYRREYMRKYRRRKAYAKIVGDDNAT